MNEYGVDAMCLLLLVSDVATVRVDRLYSISVTHRIHV